MNMNEKRWKTILLIVLCLVYFSWVRIHTHLNRAEKDVDAHPAEMSEKCFESHNNKLNLQLRYDNDNDGGDGDDGDDGDDVDDGGGGGVDDDDDVHDGGGGGGGGNMEWTGNARADLGANDSFESNASEELSDNNLFVSNDPHKDESKINSIKTILFWNEFHHGYGYGVDLGDKYLATYGCPIHQCAFTINKSEIGTVDAVVIHGFYTDPPPRRNENQVYVLYFFESPVRKMSRYKDKPKWQNVFNLTFTYMYDEETDIPAAHGMAVKLPEPNPNALTEVHEAVKEKTKMVLWIVSNCDSYNGRMEYARKLGQNIPLDIVGACGNISCPLPKTSSTCITKLAKDYMFFLSFENSHCDDYYTEKVISPLMLGMVPVTMGRANYSRVLPPGSFIDAMDYSPKQLAQKMLYLKKHLDEYLQYFQWRRDYTMVRSQRRPGFCRLCEILHTTNYPYKSNFNVSRYWDSKRLCLTKEEHLKQLGIN